MRGNADCIQGGIGDTVLRQDRHQTELKEFNGDASKRFFDACRAGDAFATRLDGNSDIEIDGVV